MDFKKEFQIEIFNRKKKRKKKEEEWISKRNFSNLIF